MSDAAWESLSNQAVAAAGLVYFLALLAHLVEWSALRSLPVAAGAERLNSVDIPGGIGTVSFDGVDRWTKLQISQTPGKWVALAGVVMALIGLLGSLFIRPRRVWVRARREEHGTLVEVAALDRSAGGDLSGEIDEITVQLKGTQLKGTVLKETV